VLVLASAFAPVIMIDLGGLGVSYLRHTENIVWSSRLLIAV